MNKSESIKSLVAALAKAQAEFPAIPRNRTVTVTSKRTGGKYTFAYAPLETILHAVRPVLKGNGLAFMQSVSGEALTTILMHTSGEWIESDPLPIRAEESGSQALGSAITYARRYALTAALGIVTEDDDDGNAADGNHVEAKPTRAVGHIPAADAKVEAWDYLAKTNGEHEFLKKITADVQALLTENREDDAYAFFRVKFAQLDADEQLAIQYWMDQQLTKPQHKALKEAGERYRIAQKAAERQERKAA